MSPDEIVVLVVLLSIIIMFAIISIVMKKPYRQMKYLIVQKALDNENKKLITDKEDLEYLEYVLEKFEWYSKKWWFNSTPTYLARWKKAKAIFEKYNLDVEVVKYTKEEK